MSHCIGNTVRAVDWLGLQSSALFTDADIQKAPTLEKVSFILPNDLFFKLEYNCFKMLC